jgi:hypothetical protein
MTPQRLMLINSMLFLVILALSVLILTEERRVPEAPPLAQLRKTVEGRMARDTTEVTVVADNYQNLGRKNMFDTIIPLPTPSPKPTPTPRPAPLIAEVTEFWKLSSMISTMAIFQDIKTKEDFTMRVGDTREVEFRKEKLTIKLEAIDRPNWRVVISMSYGGNVQRREMKLF